MIHVVHDGLPSGHRFLIISIGLHVGGEQFPMAVVVEVTHVEAHGAVGGLGKRFGRFPACIRIEPQLVAHGKVVAYENVKTAVFIHVQQQQRPRLRAVGKPSWGKFTLLIIVDKHTGSVAHHEAVAQRFFQRGIIGASHKVKVAIGVNVAPREGKGGCAIAGQGGVGGKTAVVVLPIANAAAQGGKSNVLPAIPVQIDDGNPARVGLHDALRTEGQITFVPQQSAFPLNVGEHNVEQAIVVEIVDGEPGAVAFKHGHGNGRLGDVVKRVGDKLVCAGRCFNKWRLLYREWVGGDGI